MADKKISALTASTTPLAGTEVLPIVQGGSTVKVSVADLTAGRAVAASSVAVAGVVKIGPSPTDGINIFKFGTSNLASVVYGDTATGDIIITDPSGNGNFKLTATGDVAISKAGRGIDFSANTHAAGMTSELLNDYEEGAWTPSQGTELVVVGSFSSSGTYTRIGRQVTVRGILSGSTSVSCSALGKMTNNLPFASATDTPGTYFNGNLSAGGQVDAAGSFVYAVGTIAATNNIYFSATYFV